MHEIAEQLRTEIRSLESHIQRTENRFLASHWAGELIGPFENVEGHLDEAELRQAILAFHHARTRFQVNGLLADRIDEILDRHAGLLPAQDAVASDYDEVVLSPDGDPGDTTAPDEARSLFEEEDEENEGALDADGDAAFPPLDDVDADGRPAGEPDEDVQSPIGGGLEPGATNLDVDSSSQELADEPAAADRDLAKPASQDPPADPLQDFADGIPVGGDDLFGAMHDDGDDDADGRDDADAALEAPALPLDADADAEAPALPLDADADAEAPALPLEDDAGALAVPSAPSDDPQRRTERSRPAADPVHAGTPPRPPASETADRPARPRTPEEQAALYSIFSHRVSLDDVMAGMGMEIPEGDRVALEKRLQPRLEDRVVASLRASKLAEHQYVLLPRINRFVTSSGQLVPCTVKNLAKHYIGLFGDIRDLVRYRNDALMSSEVPEPGWALVTAESPRESLGKNYMEQNQYLRYLSTTLGIPSHLVRRRTMVEAIYDLIVGELTLGEHFQRATLDWTSTSPTKNDYVCVYYPDEGIRVRDLSRITHHRSLGVTPSW